MILLAREVTLPVSVQSVKDEVLLCLRTGHALHEYDGRADLVAYLDQNLAVARLDKLKRVLLFFTDPAVLMAVEDRAEPGAVVHFRQPGCWLRLGQNLPTLRAEAERREPGWVAKTMKTLKDGTV